jgi:hypothetical protein
MLNVYAVFLSMLALTSNALVQLEHPAWRVTQPWLFHYGAPLAGLGVGLGLIVLVHAFTYAVVERKSC